MSYTLNSLNLNKHDSAAFSLMESQQVQSLCPWLLVQHAKTLLLEIGSLCTLNQAWRVVVPLRILPPDTTYLPT